MPGDREGGRAGLGRVIQSHRFFSRPGAARPGAARLRTLRLGAALVGVGVLAVSLLAPPSALGQAPGRTANRVPDADTAAAAAPTPLSPSRVVRRALVAPGWGQLTNRQPVKAVAVWGGLAAAGTGVGVSHVQYLRLRHAALYRRCETDPAPNVCTGIDGFADEAARYPGVSAATLRGLRDGARRRRDLFLLGTATVYALQALDAYVSAHLRLFDDGSDLSVGLATPGSFPGDLPGGDPGLALRLRLRLR